MDRPRRRRRVPEEELPSGEAATTQPGEQIVTYVPYLQAPQDGGGPVQIETLSNLMVAAGKTTAPDLCVETCFTQDERSERASYTVPVRPQDCP